MWGLLKELSVLDGFGTKREMNFAPSVGLKK